ncbi:hypothetical protein L1987_63673 [Smallanthus sonchifolius]|uniref:Uncharacterized protein n=1 Tax=Smallanthus sonchifolius TaxID=185202 RepID=A0ACB9CE72_9ASTR|nr:hypothetical protein L1987_63673 [Smallanthus sonchifolius]
MAVVKLISTLITDQISVVARRGFATTTQGGVSVIVRGSGIAMSKKAGEEPKKSTPWVPYPVTGYYRPEGKTNEVDAAELRELLLKQKNSQQ